MSAAIPATQRVSGPPQLGDVEITRQSETEWTVNRNGRELAKGLSFPQVLSIVRGELDIDALAKGTDGD